MGDIMKFFILTTAVICFVFGFAMGFTTALHNVDEHVQKMQSERDMFEESAARWKMEAEGKCESKSQIYQESLGYDTYNL
jgi:hypothetical protein